MTTFQAFIVHCLTQTAPLKGLERIGSRSTLPRDPKRDPETIKRDLARAYIEHRKHDHADVSAVVSVSKLHLVRRSAWKGEEKNRAGRSA